MSLTEFLSLITRIIYFLIAAITLIEFLRQRDRTRLDIALMFAALGISVLIQEIQNLTGLQSRWLGLVSSISVVAQPFLLLQLVGHFRPVSGRVWWSALIGMLASWVLLLIFAPPLPPIVTIVIIIYFAFAEAYAAIAFVRGALTTGGVTHWRLLLAALGSGLVAAVIAIAGFNIAIPALAPIIQPLTQFMGMLSAVAYYFGFAPPRWLRRAWQLPELQHFLRESAGKPATERATETLHRLCTMAMRAVGGRAALAALWNEAENQLVVHAATHPAMLSGSLAASDGAIGRAWRERQPSIARSPAELSPEGAQLAAEVGARALLAVPIATAERAWGLLVVFLQRGPLFPADDLDLLLLFTEQSAIALEQKTLVEDLRRRTGQLEAANKELEAFSYSVSHDLRAPLRHIEGFTDLLHKSSLVADDDKNRHYLRRISEATVRMGRLIDNLLDFSRLGRAEIYATPVNLDQVVEGARRELLSESEGRDVVWNVSQLPNVYGDPALLRLVFVNLLSNALKYTRSRSPAQIEIGHLPDREGQTAIYVRDNGVGFDMQYADKLFGVFQRLHRADEFEGTGIGLANVRRIIHRHGGNTWAESAPDGGATFYFSLPTLAPGLATSTTSVPLPAPGSGEDLPARTTKPSLTPSPHLMRAPEAITDD